MRKKIDVSILRRMEDLEWRQSILEAFSFPGFCREHSYVQSPGIYFYSRLESSVQRNIESRPRRLVFVDDSKITDLVEEHPVLYDSDCNDQYGVGLLDSMVVHDSVDPDAVNLLVGHKASMRTNTKYISGRPVIGMFFWLKPEDTRGTAARSGPYLLLVDLVHTGYRVEIDRFIRDIMRLCGLLREGAPEVNESRIVTTLRVGADPELELYSRKLECVRAGDFFPFEGEIGTDGAPNVLELRPSPCENGEDLATNVADLLAKVWDRGFVPTPYARRYPTGGHIHLGASEREACRTVRDYAREIVRVVDDLVGELLLEASPPARRNSNYNERRAFEVKQYGFEYRTPPSTILATPYLFMATAQLLLEVGAWVLEHDGVVDQSAVPKPVEAALGLFRHAYRVAEKMNWQMDLVGWWKMIRRNRLPDPNRFRGNIRIEVPEWAIFNESILRRARGFVRTALRNRGVPKASIVFYGLREGRGIVTNFSNTLGIPVVGDVPRLLDEGRGTYVIGLPYAVRTDPEVFQKIGIPLLKEAVEAIAEHAIGLASPEANLESVGILIRRKTAFTKNS